MHKDESDIKEAYNFIKTLRNVIGPVEETIIHGIVKTVLYQYSIQFEFMMPHDFEGGEKECKSQLPNAYFIELRNNKSEIKRDLMWLNAMESVDSSDDNESLESDASYFESEYYATASEWEEETGF